MREIVGAYHRCCTDLITRAGGFVAKYMGDGVLAYFGCWGTAAFDVNYATFNDSATLADHDYAAKGGTVHFAAAGARRYRHRACRDR
jgi:class 3 adenylate cyclase